MYIILAILLLVFFVIPNQIEQRIRAVEYCKILQDSYDFSKVSQDITGSNSLGLETMCICGYGAWGATTPIRKLNYPIGSQEYKFLDATVLYKFYVPNTEDCWLIIEAEEKDGDWLLFGCHRSSGRFSAKHNWKWECVTLKALEELRLSIKKTYGLNLTFDTRIRPGEKTLNDYVLSK